MLGKDRQLIIAISREFGSGGKEIGQLLGMHYNIPVYEKNILQQLNIARQEDIDAFYNHDEKPRWKFASRTVRGLTNSNEGTLAALEFNFLRQQADQGKSFVVLGHCAEEILKNHPALVTFFVSAPEEFKIPRIMAEHNLTEDEAKWMMLQHNWKRKTYHDTYCDHSWGDSRFHDMCLRSDRLGCRKTASLLIAYIDERFGDYSV